MKNQPMQLSLEQKLNQRMFADRVKKLSREQAQEHLVYLYKQMMLKDNMYKDLLKHQWNMDSDPFAI